jgi:PST family polysaccharide transporter
MSIHSVPIVARPLSAPDTQVLDRSLVLGIAWTSGAKWASQLLSWASTLIVARVLTPEDFGLVGMASVFLGLITLLSEFGLGSAIVTLQQLDEEQVSQIYGLSVLFGLASFVTACVAAVPLGRFFRAPELPAVVVAISAGFVITAFRTVPSSLLQRDLRFKALALVEAGRAAVLAVGMIAFALLGLRYWTLVIGGLLSAALGTVAILVLQRHRLAWPRVRSLKLAVGFSGHVLVSRLSWYTYSNADFLVAGRVLGTTALGLYDLGWTLANIPVEKITGLVSQVTPPIFSAVQHDYAALRRYLLRITEGLALITCPLCFGMALVAPDFVRFALGDKWHGAIVPLQLLALSASFRAVTPLLAQAMLAIGQSRLVMKYSMLNAVVLPAGFFLAAKAWGTVGIAWVWVLLFPVLALPVYRVVLAEIRLPARTYLRALWPALSSALLMATTVETLSWTMSDRLAPGYRLGALVGAGAAVYALTCILLHRERITAFYRFVGAVRLAEPRPDLSSAPQLNDA